MPLDVFIPDYFDLELADAWYRLGENERGDKTLLFIVDIYDQQLSYFFDMDREKIKGLYRESGMALQTINECQRIAMRHNREAALTTSSEVFGKYSGTFEKVFNMQMQ
jgi:hypothetical protein